jgi:cytoskeletal protein RodZ
MKGIFIFKPPFARFGGFFMQFINKIVAIKKFKLSPLLALSGLSFIVAIFLFAIPQKPHKETPKIAKSVNGTTNIQPSEIPTIAQTQTSYITAQPSPTLLPTSTNQNTTAASNQTSFDPSPTPTIQPTQTQNKTVNLQIQEPDGTSNFSVSLNPGNTLCDNLTEAKQEGKIKSVTLDNSYMSSLHSAYVREINGYQNNWTVSVNGKTPQGCSLYSPNSGDAIVWKFN